MALFPSSVGFDAPAWGKENDVAKQLWHICTSHIVIQIGKLPMNRLDGSVGKAKLNQNLCKLIVLQQGGYRLMDSRVYGPFNELSNKKQYLQICIRRKGPMRE